MVIRSLIVSFLDMNIQEIKDLRNQKEWWKSSEYIGVETWDVPKIVAESRRRTLDEVREMLMAEWKEDRNAHSVELLNNVLNKLDEMK